MIDEMGRFLKKRPLRRFSRYPFLKLGTTPKQTKKKRDPFFRLKLLSDFRVFYRFFQKYFFLIFIIKIGSYYGTYFTH